MICRSWGPSCGRPGDETSSNSGQVSLIIIIAIQWRALAASKIIPRFRCVDGEVTYWVAVRLSSMRGICICSTSNALIISSPLWASGGDISLSVMTGPASHSWHRDGLVTTDLPSSLRCVQAPSHWNAILQNWYKAQNNTIVFLRESSFKIASRYFQPTSSHP